MAEMYEIPREMCEMPRADSPDAVYAEVTPVGEPEAASRGEKRGKCSRLKVFLAALFAINFIFTGVCFYMVMEMKLEIVNYERQIGELKSKQIGNRGEEVTTEPQPVEGPMVMKGQKGEISPNGPRGVKESMGAKGQKGEIGPIDPLGVQGSMGAKGQKGEIGPTGPRGEKGQKGNPGNTPPKGDKGEVGTVGQQGPVGPKGRAGEKGYKGSSGQKGSKGQKGEIDTTPLRRIEGFQGVRLVNGGSDYGRVEVLHNGVWGTVCDDGWDTADATVLCKMMGFKGASYVRTSAFYGEGSGQIWLDELGCDSSNKNVQECGGNSWGHNDCSHGEDAGAACYF